MSSGEHGTESEDSVAELQDALDSPEVKGS